MDPGSRDGRRGRDSGRNRARGRTAALLAAAVILGLAGSALAAQTTTHPIPQPMPSGTLDSILTSYRSASLQWLDRIISLGMGLFRVLAVIEFSTAALMWMLKRGDWEEQIRSMVLKTALVGGWWMVLLSVELWIPPIFDSLRIAGLTGVQMPTLNPSEIVDVGVKINGMILLGTSLGGAFMNPVLTAMACVINLGNGSGCSLPTRHW